MGLMGNVFSNSLQLLVAAHCPHRNTSSYVFAQLCNIQMGNVCMSRFKISLFTKHFIVTNLFYLTDLSDTVSNFLSLVTVSNFLISCMLAMNNCVWLVSRMHFLELTLLELDSSCNEIKFYSASYSLIIWFKICHKLYMVPSPYSFIRYHATSEPDHAPFHNFIKYEWTWNSSILWTHCKGHSSILCQQDD